ncbi:unnamed protein product [Protopolystoma xenopodis]|uniref:BSD domain-containing protein n=1 Tax=Protopolystoma xenopodis TaxID=117903 RepID=A0A448XSH8_9PLAT|nr:unnamed protein product [Protopolystoma xenopodis]
MQRISPDAKEKVQLQLLMHNGESYTFQFADPAGKSIQLQMRNSVKELLQTLLSKFKDKLVVTGLLSSEEFWARPEFTSSTDTAHSQPVPTKHGQSQDSTSEHPSGQLSQCFQQHQNKLQAVGVPNYLLSDIKPEADGANGIKYNLTHETIEAIFLAYPMVRQRHKDLVPDTLSEADFWIKFFQSHYFHR